MGILKAISSFSNAAHFIAGFKHGYIQTAFRHVTSRTQAVYSSANNNHVVYIFHSYTSIYGFK
ncbi:hypothetical protein PITCH_A1920004 [uncultured Desulfobacterium sp.]|uniref:Uncharacterized protein n=1 Tax=uncultured Desulfobacterium sp. TaxID=201089 RepID=A0A445MW32_9BACT|nr:hypothetical protein PITCH_A1920004 [uncultured Desulfobacterium sp.]